MAAGGTKNYGIIYRIKPDGTGDTILLNFYSINGHGAVASLVSDGTYLYGSTVHGGTYGDGIIYRVKPNGTGDTILLTFNGTDGGNIYSPLLFVNKYLYGLSDGVSSNSGVLFRIKPDGTGDTILHYFVSASGDIPSNNSLISVGAYLYGMTPSGGAYNDGVVFRYLDSALLTDINEPPVMANEVKVYPNPSDGKFTIESSVISRQSLEIYNMLGEKIYTETLRPVTQGQGGQVQGDNTINLSNEAKGLYLYRLLTPEGKFISQGKFIIQ